MSEKSGGFNKILILIILAGAAYFYYDKNIRVSNTGSTETPTATVKDDELPGDTLDTGLIDNLQKDDYKMVIQSLSTKETLTQQEKFQLGMAYREAKEYAKASPLLEELNASQDLTMDTRASVCAALALIGLETNEVKKGMDIWGQLIQKLDPMQLPSLDLELGDKLWEKFGNKVNTYWYEMYYAYGLAYNSLVEGNPRFAEIEARLQKLSNYIFFTSSEISNLKSHMIQSGDRIINIAKQYGVPKELVELTNGLSASSVIREGNRLKIVEGVSSVRINKKKYTLILYLNGIFIKRYHIGLGKENKTPEGIFKVNATGKMTRPPWYNRKTGVELEYSEGGVNGNPLGTHWIPFSEGDGIGIHGTWDPGSIGKDESNGCVRMLNNEVKEIYAFMKEGSMVEIE